MGGSVTVAACRFAARIDAPDREIMVRAVRAAAVRGAALVVVPELAVCGYAFGDAAEARASAEPLDGPTVSVLRELSAELGVVLVAGLAELGADGRVYNTAVLLEAGVLRASYRKVHLWGREPELFAAGSAPPPVLDTAVGRVAVLICYDLEFPEWVRAAAQAGAEIIAAPVNWPRRPGPAGPATEPPLEVLKARVAAGTYRVHVVVADRCGTERGTSWFGAALVCTPDGALAAGPPPAASDGEPGPALVTAVIEPARARDKSVGP
ncbi:nitrilase-related carbon-nitrogen hydrolase, partial [Pseudonocardia sp. KRD291]|uniref:nitrilase-related carbon-nitrogen hydrolase n=1 Tax=Pseudonocardia sp. KRD291 TaxID=2792007 RepID=UPI001C4A079A